MTDPLNPSHDEPAEGPRESAYSGASGAETHQDSASEAAANASARANDVFEQIKVVVEDVAEKAAPTVRELSAKAAELVAVAADKAAPIAKQAGEATADVSAKLAERSRGWAAEIREQVAAAGGDGSSPMGGATTTPGTSKRCSPHDGQPMRSNAHSVKHRPQTSARRVPWPASRRTPAAGRCWQNGHRLSCRGICPAAAPRPLVDHVVGPASSGAPSSAHASASGCSIASITNARGASSVSYASSTR